MDLKPIEWKISDIDLQILEFVRDGDKRVADLMDMGKQLLGRWIQHLLYGIS